MPYMKCTVCGKVQSLDISICPRCIEMGNDETKILAIKKYIEKYPDAKFKDVSKALKIKEEVIDKFIEEGRIELVYDEDGFQRIVENKKDQEAKKKEADRIKMLRELSGVSNGSTRNMRMDRRSQLLIDLGRQTDDGQER